MIVYLARLITRVGLMTKQELQAFFKVRPAISIRQFFIEAGYSQGKWPIEYLSDDRDRDVPEGILIRIVPLLSKYGHETEGVLQSTL